MIEKIEIINFQSHKHTVIHLDKGINCIIGRTDSGKSAVIRALNFVLFNQPTGDSFKSTWGGGTSVKLWLKEGGTIERKKTNKDNSYIIDNKTVLTAFGAGKVPTEVAEKLNVGSINLQNQIEPLFLLTETAGKVAKFFNEIANIDEIDTLTSNISKEVRTIKLKKQLNDKIIDNKRTELKKYSNLPEKEKKLNKAKFLHKNLLKTELRLNEIQTISDELSVLLSKKKRMSDFNLKIAPVQKALDLNQAYINNNNEIKIVKEYIEKLNKINKKRINIKSINTLLQITDKLINCFREMCDIKNLINQYSLIKEKSKRLVVELRNDNQLFEKNFPKKCPLCGR